MLLEPGRRHRRSPQATGPVTAARDSTTSQVHRSPKTTEWFPTKGPRCRAHRQVEGPSMRRVFPGALGPVSYESMDDLCTVLGEQDGQWRCRRRRGQHGGIRAFRGLRPLKCTRLGPGARAQLVLVDDSRWSSRLVTASAGSSVSGSSWSSAYLIFFFGRRARAQQCRRQPVADEQVVRFCTQGARKFSGDAQHAA